MNGQEVRKKRRVQSFKSSKELTKDGLYKDFNLCMDLPTLFTFFLSLIIAILTGMR